MIFQSLANIRVSVVDQICLQQLDLWSVSGTDKDLMDWQKSFDINDG